MPLTFPSHAAAVLPLKLWRRHRLDGVALVIGSMLPDLAYALDGSWLERPVPGLPPLWQLGHGPFLILWVPAAALPLCWAVRWAAPVAAVHLPSWLRGYASIRRRPGWAVTFLCAMAGAATHAVWDKLAVGFWDVVSTLAGAVVAVAFFIHFGRTLPPPLPAEPAPLPPLPVDASDPSTRRPLLRDASELSARRRPKLFWSVASVTMAAVALASPLLPGASLPRTTLARLILGGIAATLLACVAVRARARSVLARR